ncbi:Thiamine biosynthesis lipoprotein ApbE precursor [Gimesia panareensis]|uniref:FAD:protein FMN transferase n=1 Tax=Gimesia panareensis TaxID=2527978 RepID=A0A517QAS2_9PLAN|nr:FAD:protein FMN transferase [Gimesia panareensis]QDT28728.1 Thiamine biosynthesis lipoprotein ApbE precursor [Gimesia panareensis]
MSYIYQTCLLLSTLSGNQQCTDSEILHRYEFQEVHMGVQWRIVLYATDKPIANNASQIAFRRVKELNKVLSDYDPNSELNQLCQLSGPGKPVKVSLDLFKVLKRSQALSRETDGAFDVTISPVVRLWRRARRRKQMPDSERLQTARDLVGSQWMRLSEQNQTVELLKPGMRLDLGGIAKGYAADVALHILKAHGIDRVMIDASGDLALGDPPPGSCGWKIGISSSDAPGAKIDRYLQLKNCAVATSGDALQHVVIDGTRYSHIVNPHTGLGLTDQSRVTVITPDGMSADSLASAISVLGPEKGIALLSQKPGTACLILRHEQGELKSYESPCFSCFELPPTKP